MRFRCVLSFTRNNSSFTQYIIPYEIVNGGYVMFTFSNFSMDHFYLLKSFCQVGFFILVNLD